MQEEGLYYCYHGN